MGKYARQSLFARAARREKAENLGGPGHPLYEYIKKKTGKPPSRKGKGKGRKRSAAKSRREAANKDWKTRRQKYGKDGHKG